MVRDHSLRITVVANLLGLDSLFDLFSLQGSNPGTIHLKSQYLSLFIHKMGAMRLPNQRTVKIKCYYSASTGISESSTQTALVMRLQTERSSKRIKCKPLNNGDVLSLTFSLWLLSYRDPPLRHTHFQGIRPRLSFSALTLPSFSRTFFTINILSTFQTWMWD